MTGQAVKIIGDAFTACWGWFVDITERIDAFGYILSGIIIMFIVSLFLMPFRGGSIVGGDFADYTAGGIRAQRREERRAERRSKKKES